MSPGHEITWSGPFKFISEFGEESLFDKTPPDIVKEKGLYLWTVRDPKNTKRYMVYYVGVSTTSFRNRLEEHIEAYLAGNYKIYDAQEMRSCSYNKDRPIYHSDEKVTRGAVEFIGFVDFLSEYPSLANKAYELVKVFDIFLAPLPEDTSKLEMEIIESAIINKLWRKHGSPEAMFLDNAKRSTKTPLGETVLMGYPKDVDEFIGLGQKLTPEECSPDT